MEFFMGFLERIFFFFFRVLFCSRFAVLFGGNGDGDGDDGGGL